LLRVRRWTAVFPAAPCSSLDGGFARCSVLDGGAVAASPAARNRRWERRPPRRPVLGSGVLPRCSMLARRRALFRLGAAFFHRDLREGYLIPEFFRALISRKKKRRIFNGKTAL
jgi:hypothetical protein